MNTSTPYYFGSDNFSPAHPRILEFLSEINNSPAPSYGKDQYTQKMVSLFEEQLGSDIAVYPVFSGSAANVTAITAMLKPYEAVICSDQSHLHTDECGAMESHAGRKVLALPSVNGKISAEQLENFLQLRNPDEHRVQPKVVSLTQSTEYGTVYSLKEMKAISQVAHKNGLWLHVDGARIANAAVSLEVSFHELLTETGVDAVSFGGTKNGLMFGEAVVFFGKDRFSDYRFNRMQGLQLDSKMRYLSAQFIPYLEEGLWKGMATHANQMATLLAREISNIDIINITQPIQANAVFVQFSPTQIEALHQEYYFYEWNTITQECRLMFSWDTSEDSVQYFARRIREVCKKHVQ